MGNFKYIFGGLIVFLSSCNSNKTNFDEDRFFSYNQKSKTLTISEGIERIKIKTKKNLTHSIYLDSNFQIERINNVIKSPLTPIYINTWYSFDKQSNVLDNNSYYYDTYLSTSNDTIYLNFVALKSIFDGDFYAILGGFDEEFKLNFPFHVDTFRIDKRSIISLPILDYKIGRNNIRFIVVEERLKNDTLHQRKTFVDKDFYIK